MLSFRRFTSKLTRKWRRLLATVAVALICVTLLVYSSSFLGHDHHDQVTLPNEQQIIEIVTTNSPKHPTPSTVWTELTDWTMSTQEEFILDQPSCRIPRTQIMPDYFKKGNPGAWYISHVPNCSYEKLLAVLEEGDEGSNEILRLINDDKDIDSIGHGANMSDPPGGAGKCCVREIWGSNPLSDHGYKLGSCEFLQNGAPISVHGKQMLVVKCGKRLNFEATFPTDTPAIKDKFAHWNKIQRQTPTISILMIGLESASRAHAYRSLPRTLDYMTSQLDFNDFQGYHSTETYTMGNFAPLLMGLPESQVRQNCDSGSTVWDSCPFIWKEFDEAGYVTMYAEDGRGTFDWGQSGFAKNPTDYYIAPLFEALAKLRHRHSRPLASKTSKTSWGQYNQGYCMSNETVPQFMVRYLRRFVDKFNPKSYTADTTTTGRKTPPFFVFTFLQYPFHHNMYALSTMDQELLHLMQHLNSDRLRPLLESTLIILLGDHGDRYSFFQSDSMEAYIERSMPPLFIRVPEQFRQKFPDYYAKALEWNAKHRLVTPLDVHHTMLHVLNLDSKDEDFIPVQDDRSSLFLPIGGDRTCSQLNVGRCVCNVSLNPESLSHPTALNQLSRFIETALNQFVLESGYQHLCANWTTTGGESILSARILQKKRHKIPRSQEPTGTLWLTLEVLLKFRADPLGALFEVKVSLQLDGVAELIAGSAKVLGDFTRINMYGEQSACIPGKTDRDKKMKELCVCLDYDYNN